MKRKARFKYLYLAIAIFALIFTVTSIFGSAQNGVAYAADDDYYYGFEYEKFYVTYDINSDRTYHVKEEMEIRFTGVYSTGVIRDIPVNAGDRVRNIKVYKGGFDESVREYAHDVYSEDSSFVSVKISDGINKTNEVHAFVLEYDFAITSPEAKEKNALFINAVGFGHTAEMKDVHLELNLPDGFKSEDINCYYGKRGNDNPDNSVWTLSGNKIVCDISELNQYTVHEGVTFAIGFDDGVLSVAPDMTPYWIIIVACGLLAILVILKFLVFNKNALTPIINTSAPDDMDPLVMGKLIDNKVNDSDVTSLIYYWANKGYININFISENDVELLRIMRRLPNGSPNYQKVMYDSLFARGDAVNINSLAAYFYPTVQKVTAEVNAKNSKLYDGKSMAAAIIFAILGALFMGLTPVLMTLFGISMKYFTIAPLIVIIPTIVIFALTQLINNNRLKLNKGKLALMYLGVILLAAVFSAFYVLLVPSYIIEIVPKILICAIGYAIAMLASLLVCRTQAYTKQLNKIVGFRQFILTAEKDKLETMLEQNPEFYYQVLPYAIVLNVSDIWEHKFDALTIAPPSWGCGSCFVRTYFSVRILTGLTRGMRMHMMAGKVQHVSHSGLSGGGRGGGSFGGFSGGGHGGGGSRGC